jgi:hypothetical protein
MTTLKARSASMGALLSYWDDERGRGGEAGESGETPCE